MARVLTENQVLLTGYLFEIGCETGAVFKMVLELWDEEAVLEMLEFCHDNPDASQAKLLQMSSKISSKYNGTR